MNCSIGIILKRMTLSGLIRIRLFSGFSFLQKNNYHLLLILALFGEVLYSQTIIIDKIDAYGKLESGAYSEAAYAFKAIENKIEFSANDRLSLGIAQFKSGDVNPARSNLLDAESKGISEASIWLARLYASNKNSNDALFYIERYLKTSKIPDIEGIQKDSTFRFMHESEKWFDLWQTDWYTVSQKIIDEALFYAGRKKYKAAHEIFESALTEGNAKAELFFWNGKIYLLEENPTLAINEFNQAIILNPDNTSYLKARASGYSFLNENKLALEDLKHAIEIDPYDFDIRLLRAKAAFLAEDYEMASEDISLYLKYFNSEDAEYFAGKIASAAGNYYDALTYFNRLMKDAKPKAVYFSSRGMTYYETGSYDLASKDLSMSLDLEPENPEVNYYMGMAEFNKGNKNGACYFMKRAKAFGDLNAIVFLQKNCN